MIKYQKGLNGLLLLFRFTGTSWPYGIMPGLFSAGIGLVLSHIESLDDLISDKTRFVDNPYPYQLFAYLVGFVLVFRTNFGYLRYWEALDAVQRMGSKWLDGACMAVAFDAKGDVSHPFLQPAQAERHAAKAERCESACGAPPQNGVSHEEFFVEVVHLFSLMHALALQHLRCDSDLENLALSPHSDIALTQIQHSSSNNKLARFGTPKAGHTLTLHVLGGLLPEERATLANNSQGHPLPSVARVTMVESWIMRRLVARQKYEPAGDMGKTAPPILSRMVQVVSDGHLGFSQAAKAAETPFPFPYQNMIRMFLWLFALTSPFVINSKVLWVPARFVINFLSVWAYFSLAEVGDNLEDPYMPYDPNDLPLEAIQHSFNARLLSFGTIPESKMVLSGLMEGPQ